MGNRELLKKIALILIIFTLYGIYQYLFGYRTVEASDNPNQQTIIYPDYYITGERNVRSGLGDVDATETYIYIRYGQTVDAYDYQGNYDHSLVFTAQARNGGTIMDCSSDMLYVTTRDQKIHAFRGTEYLGTINREEMRQLRATLPSDSRVFAGWEGMYKRCEDGTAEYLFPLPEVLAKSMPPIVISTHAEKIIGYIFWCCFSSCASTYLLLVCLE